MMPKKVIDVLLGRKGCFPLLRKAGEPPLPTFGILSAFVDDNLKGKK